jgi:uncharacterized coiled-coil protein SlyX
MEKAAAGQQRIIRELNSVVADIERCEKTIKALQAEMEAVGAKHKDRKTTREDIAFLTDVLKCANKKLVWEKQVASLQKRMPVVLETVTKVMNDPQNPPAEQTRVELLRSLEAIQTAMQRLQSVKTE